MRGASDSIFRSTLTKLTGNCGDFPGIDRDPSNSIRVGFGDIQVPSVSRNSSKIHEPRVRANAVVDAIRQRVPRDRGYFACGQGDLADQSCIRDRMPVRPSPVERIVETHLAGETLPAWKSAGSPVRSYVMSTDWGIHWKVHLFKRGLEHVLSGIRIKPPNPSSLTEVEIASETRHFGRRELSSWSNRCDFTGGGSDFSQS